MKCRYLFLPLLVSPIFPTNIQALAIQPIQGESTECHQQLENSRQQITQINNLELVKAESGKYTYAEAGRPGQVTHSINFIVEGKGGSNLINSPALQKSIATEILTQCEKVGSVIFVVNNSDWAEVIGKMEDGSVQSFACAEDLTDISWGLQPCL